MTNPIIIGKAAEEYHANFERKLMTANVEAQENIHRFTMLAFIISRAGSPLQATTLNTLLVVYFLCQNIQFTLRINDIVL